MDDSCANAAEGHLGQPRPVVVRRGGSTCACPELAEGDARSEAVVGEPLFSRGHALPGYGPEFNAD